MEEKKTDFFDVNAEESKSSYDFDIKKYVSVVKNNFKQILVWGLIGGLIGIGIGFSKPKEYTTTAVIAPELTTRNSSGLSSLASLAGINMNTLAITDAIHPDIYPLIISSESFLLDLLDSDVWVHTKDSVFRTTLFDYQSNYTRSPWWSAIIGLPGNILKSIKGLFVSEDESIPVDYVETGRKFYTRDQRMMAAGLRRQISSEINKKTYTLILKVTTQDQYLTEELCGIVIDKLKKFVLNYRTEKAIETVDYYEKVTAETKIDYQKAQSEYARYADSNQGLFSKSSLIEQTRLQNEATLRYQVYNSSVQSLLSARAKVQLEAPVLMVVQPGTVPLFGKPSKVKLGVLGFVLLAFVSSILFLFKPNLVNIFAGNGKS